MAVYAQGDPNIKYDINKSCVLISKLLHSSPLSPKHSHNMRNVTLKIMSLLQTTFAMIRAHSGIVTIVSLLVPINIELTRKCASC